MKIDQIYRYGDDASDLDFISPIRRAMNDIYDELVARAGRKISDEEFEQVKTALIARRRAVLDQADASDTTLPLLDEWTFLRHPLKGHIYASGIVSGHPSIPNGPSTTSAVFFWDRDRGMFVTETRVYRTGHKSARMREIEAKHFGGQPVTGESKP